MGRGIIIIKANTWMHLSCHLLEPAWLDPPPWSERRADLDQNGNDSFSKMSYLEESSWASRSLAAGSRERVKREDSKAFSASKLAAAALARTGWWVAQRSLGSEVRIPTPGAGSEGAMPTTFCSWSSICSAERSSPASP